MKKENYTMHDAVLCPVCGYKIDCASPLEKDEEYTPDEGSLSICLKCTTVLEFKMKDGKLALIKAAPEILEEIKRKWPDQYVMMVRTQAAIKQMWAKEN